MGDTTQKLAGSNRFQTPDGCFRNATAQPVTKCDKCVTMNSCNCLVVCWHWSWCSWVCESVLWFVVIFFWRKVSPSGWMNNRNIHISPSSKTVETPSFWKIGRLPNHHLGITLFMHYPYASRNECQITNTVHGANISQIRKILFKTRLGRGYVSLPKEAAHPKRI